MCSGLLGWCSRSDGLIGLDTMVYTEFAPMFQETFYIHLHGKGI